MVAPLLTKWMLVFEDPNSNTLWLAKATPRNWMEDGKTISVTNAPTRWGSISFTLRSHLAESRIDGTVILPPQKAPDIIKLRLRVPEGNQIHSVMIGSRNWGEFDVAQETVTLRGRSKQRIELAVQY
jgi:hypothetical protein